MTYGVVFLLLMEWRYIKGVDEDGFSTVQQYVFFYRECSYYLP